MLKQLKSNKTRKRCQNRNKITKMHSIKFYGINAAGIKCKQKSFENVLITIKPQIWTIQETKLKPNEKINCEALNEYQVYYLSRQHSQGGGLALGVSKDIESALIREGDDDTEILSVQIVAGDFPIRIVTGYGPQENSNSSIKEKFWEFLEQELIQAEIENQGLLVQIDGNLHAGPQLVKQDPNPQNNNGKIFMDFLERNPNLVVVNTLDLCEGIITRKRIVREHVKKHHGTNPSFQCEECEDICLTEEELNTHITKIHFKKSQIKCGVCRRAFLTEKDFKEHNETGHEKIEEAVLDFLIVNEKMRPFLQKMLIDEERMFSLANVAQIKKNKRIIESDHNPIILDLNIQYSKRKPDRIEMFNLKNKACQEMFKFETDNNQEIIKVFSTDLAFEDQCTSWLKIFNSILYKCFKKVRIVGSKKHEQKDINKDLFERVKLQKELHSGSIDEDTRNKIKNRIIEVENKIEIEMGDENLSEIVKTLRYLGGNERQLGPNGRKQLWKILKEKYPTKITPAVPIGKKDRRGNVITNYEGLKQLYLETYTHRLRNRPINPELHDLQQMKMKLFDLRLELSEFKKSKVWTIEDLEDVLKALKNDKARDPNGWLNEIFKTGVAGKNLKFSMLELFNKIKTENYIPEFMRKADVSTIYKGKGDKSDLSNDRGIFLITIFRNILMKLIYKDIYQEIDESMSDSQVGSRKGKNIRNHVWIINGIINDVLSKKNKESLDLQIFDYKQCFDSLWLEESLNDIYDGGLQDDKFQLLYNTNQIVNVAVKTPVGKTIREPIYKAIIQGDVIG